jgi:hypothetical protein
MREDAGKLCVNVREDWSWKSHVEEHGPFVAREHKNTSGKEEGKIE